MSFLSSSSSSAGSSPLRLFDMDDFDMPDRPIKKYKMKSMAEEDAETSDCTITSDNKAHKTVNILIPHRDPSTFTSVLAPPSTDKEFWGNQFWGKGLHFEESGPDDSPPQVSYMGLPVELALDIISHLRPTEVIKMRLVNRATKALIDSNLAALADAIIELRYPLIARCFPLPVAARSLDPTVAIALANPARDISSTTGYGPCHHLPTPNATKICSCNTCTLAWAHLAVALDFSAAVKFLSYDAIPADYIERANARLVRRTATTILIAVRNPLMHATILERHLATITARLGRHLTSPQFERCHPRLFYWLTADEIAAGTDAFLARHGEPSPGFPLSRDAYHEDAMMAYMPTRAWDSEEQAWRYGVGQAHEADCAAALREWQAAQGVVVDSEQ